MAEYTTKVQALLDTALSAGRQDLQRASEIVGTTFNAGGLLYIFGSGHSHVFAEEAFYRAGGAARVCPILEPAHMLHEGAVHSTELERQTGHAENILRRYRLDGSRDCMLVVSNSGANALPIEVATAARERGLPVIAVTSLAYSRAIERPGPRLYEIADVVIDNHCPPGDALVELGPDLPATGPGSSVVGLALLNALIVGALEFQQHSGRTPDVFISANMPGAKEHNAAVVKELSEVVPHL
jgi:uncharacterized phosphosugar-binding protein